VLRAAKSLSAGGAHNACAELAIRAVLNTPDAVLNHWGAFLVLQGILVTEGRDDEVARLIDSLATAGMGTAKWLFILDVIAGANLEDKAREVALSRQREYGALYQGFEVPLYQWLLGVWHASLGDLEQVSALQAALAKQGEQAEARPARLFAKALAAHITLLTNDTTAALAQFRDLVPTGPRATLEWDLAEPLPVERLILAELLLTRGAYREAYEVAAAFEHQGPVVYLAYLPASLVLRYRAAEVLGRHDLVTQNREALLSLGRHDLVRSLLPPTTSGRSR
jgi:hypothetical protein